MPIPGPTPDETRYRFERIERDVAALNAKLDMVLARLDTAVLAEAFIPRREASLLFQASIDQRTDHEKRIERLETFSQRNTALLIATLVTALGSLALRVLNIGP